MSHYGRSPGSDSGSFTTAFPPIIPPFPIALCFPGRCGGRFDLSLLHLRILPHPTFKSRRCTALHCAARKTSKPRSHRSQALAQTSPDSSFQCSCSQRAVLRLFTLRLLAIYKIASRTMSRAQGHSRLQGVIVVRRNCSSAAVVVAAFIPQLLPPR